MCCTLVDQIYSVKAHSGSKLRIILEMNSDIAHDRLWRNESRASALFICLRLTVLSAVCAQGHRWTLASSGRHLYCGQKIKFDLIETGDSEEDERERKKCFCRRNATLRVPGSFLKAMPIGVSNVRILKGLYWLLEDVTENGDVSKVPP